MSEKRDELKKKLKEKIKMGQLKRSSNVEKEKYLDENIKKMGVEDTTKFKEELKKMNPEKLKEELKKLNISL